MMETLYPQRHQLMLGDSSTLIHQQRTDKSPKGSVDDPIQELIDLINAHSTTAISLVYRRRTSWLNQQAAWLSVVQGMTVE
jgi:tRNA(Phe) wybutosine-synthesizing methylase Tyw3